MPRKSGVAVTSLHSTRLLLIGMGNLLRTSGFSQQFFMEVAALKRWRYQVFVLVFCGVKLFRDRALVRGIRQQYNELGVHVYIMPCFFTDRFLLELFYYPIVWFIIAYFISVKKVRIIHTHAYEYALSVLMTKLFGPIKVLVDLHGVGTEEGIYRKELKEGSTLHRYANLKEKVVFQLADVTFCVSERMIRYYMSKQGLPMERFALTRSSFDGKIFKDFNFDMKKEAKVKLGLEGKNVLLYMGHKKAWQLTRDVIELYLSVKKDIGDVFIIFLTDDVEGIHKAFKALRQPEVDYMVRHVPHEEVALYSYAADAGIIIRDDSIVNRASSPVKFSEYLASGNPVLVSASVGDLASIVEKYEVGFVIEKECKRELISYLRSLFRDGEATKEIAERCRRVAEKEFSVDNTIRVFRVYYESRVRGA